MIWKHLADLVKTTVLFRDPPWPTETGNLFYSPPLLPNKMVSSFYTTPPAPPPLSSKEYGKNAWCCLCSLTNSFLLCCTRNLWLEVCTFLERPWFFWGIKFIARVPTLNLMWNSTTFPELPRFSGKFKDLLFQIKLAVYFSPSRILKHPSQWFLRTFQGLFLSRIFKDCGNPVFDHHHLSVL